MPREESIGGRRAESEGYDRRLGVALAVVVLALSAPVVHKMGEQQASRLAFTAAVWDHGTFEIDRYEEILGRDRAVVDGTTYSDKAPAQPLLALPFYGVYRLVGGPPAEIPRSHQNMGLWWLTIWSSAIPAALLAVLMYRWSASLEPTTALASALSLAAGTLLLPYATLLFGHVMTALFAFAAFLIVRDTQSSGRRLVAAGALAGLAVLTEYPTALIVALTLIAALVIHGRKTGWFVLGGTPALVAMLFHNWLIFGGPLTFPYQWTAWTAVKEEAADLSLVAVQSPTFATVAEALFDQRGLLVATPIILIGIAGIGLLWRRGRRVDASVAAGAVLAMLALLATRGNAFAGGPGPRYFIPAIPFLALPVAVFWRRFRRTSLIAAAVSVLTMVAATWTEPQLGPTLEAGLGYWLKRAGAGLLPDTVFTIWLGAWGWALGVSVVAASVWWLVRRRAEVGIAIERSPVDLHQASELSSR